MSDPAHEYTDEEIRRVERRLAREYKQAGAEIQQKMEKYLERSAVNNEKKRKQVENGELSEEEYKKWLYGQTMVGQRWKEMRENLAVDYHNANLRAKGIAEKRLPRVYAENFNFGTYSCEEQTKIKSAFTLYNERAVRKLAADNPKLLPARKTTNGAKNKDISWNKKKITSAMMQGILQGEPIDKVANRLQAVTDMNRNAAIRNARTMMTCVQNSARLDSFIEMQEKTGVPMSKRWLATLDGRTRHSHRIVDGTTVKLTEPFANGLQFPADPDGAPAEVYNCRCRLVMKIDEIDDDLFDMSNRNTDKLEADYDTWKHEHDREHVAEIIGESVADAIADGITNRAKDKEKQEKEDNQEKETITPEHQQEIDDALEYYVSGEGMYINDYLSGKYEENGGRWTEQDEEILQLMDEGTQGIVKQKKLWRSVDASAVFGDMSMSEYQDLYDMVVWGEDSVIKNKRAATKARVDVTGKEITEPRFMSTTTDKELAFEWRDYTGSDMPIVLEIDVPDGIHGEDMKRFDLPDDPQNEVLLARGQKYRVKSVEGIDGELVVKVELIPDKKKKK